MLFRPGHSGNPAGRPRGVGKYARYRTLLQANAESLIQAVVDQALAGDTTALKLCLDRLLPPCRSEALPVTLPLSGDLTEQSGAVIAALFAGTLTPDAAVTVLHALKARADLVELKALEERLTALEARDLESPA